MFRAAMIGSIAAASQAPGYRHADHDPAPRGRADTITGIASATGKAPLRPRSEIF
jgi:hypothetical protein